MQNYKDANGKIHFLDSADYKHLLPADCVEITDEEAAQLRAPPPPTPEQLIAQYTALIQQRLDAFAKSRGYDGILSVCTYATSSVPKFKAEGQYAVQARDNTWAAGAAILADVAAGKRTVPTWEALEAELPALAWPV